MKQRLMVLTAAIVVVAFGLAGCGSGAEDNSQSSAGSKVAITDDGNWPKTIEHALGETEIPSSPKRIVALDASVVDAVILLESNVVGYTQYRATDGIPEYLGDAGEAYGKDAVSVGTLAEPSLEKIAALKPDLIISAVVRHKEIYDQLALIAPSVMSETTGPTWKENILLFGKTLGKADLAKKKLSDYESRAEKVGAAINEKAGNPTVSIVRFMDGTTRLYLKKSFSGIVMQDAGVTRPAAQNIDDFASEISEENIPDAEGDYIFVTTSVGEDGSSGPAAKQEAAFGSNPLWAKLTGQIVEVSDALWMTGVGIQGANKILDDMAKTFDVDPATYKI